MTDTLSIALCQIAPQVGDIDGNVARILKARQVDIYAFSMINREPEPECRQTLHRFPHLARPVLKSAGTDLKNERAREIPILLHMVQEEWEEVRVLERVRGAITANTTAAITRRPRFRSSRMRSLMVYMRSPLRSGSLRTLTLRRLCPRVRSS